MQDTLTIELPNDLAEEVAQLLKDEGASPASFAARRLSGSEALVTIVVPVTVGAVQVVASFLAARWSAKHPEHNPAPAINIFVNSTPIAAGDLTPENAQEVITAHLAATEGGDKAPPTDDE